MKTRENVAMVLTLVFPLLKAEDSRAGRHIMQSPAHGARSGRIEGRVESESQSIKALPSH